MIVTRRDVLLLAGSGALLARGEAAQAGADTGGKARLMQGPMLGAVEHDKVQVWVRASEPAELTLQLSTTPDFTAAAGQSTQRTDAARDLTAVLAVDGLEPRTPYLYRVLVNGRPDPYIGTLQPFRVQTAPARGEPSSFAIAFGSCARYALDSEQAIWNAVRARQPDPFLWLGDNVYGDSLNAAALPEEYRRQRAVASFQPLARNVPQLAIWDDHDYGLNNQDRTNPMRAVAQAAFQNYWTNSAYGLPYAPGVFFKYGYGAIDLFMLDSRSYRDPNDAADIPGKTLLGAEQREWLMEGLASSEAVFKVLACGSGWTRAKGPGGDSWAAFLHERDAFFEFIRSEQIGGVILLSGDTHVGELNAIPWSDRGGYDLYDLVSSPLAQPCDDDWLERSPEVRIRPVHAKSTNFGSLRFELDGEPRLTYELIDSSGRPVWSPLRLTARELSIGQTTWRSKTQTSHPIDTPAKQSFNAEYQGDYDLDEDVLAGYAMGRWNVGRLELIGGVRIEQTEISSAGFERGESNTARRAVGEGEYTDVLPGVIARFNLTDDLVLRGAWTNTLGRPNYEQIAPIAELTQDGANGELSIGNPELEARESRNLDVALEWYFARGGLLTIAGFHKDIEDDIVSRPQTFTNYTYNGVTYDRFDVTSVENSIGAKLEGAEIAYQQQFYALPSPWDGLRILMQEAVGTGMFLRR